MAVALWFLGYWAVASVSWGIAVRAKWPRETYPFGEGDVRALAALFWPIAILVVVARVLAIVSGRVGAHIVAVLWRSYRRWKNRPVEFSKDRQGTYRARKGGQ